MTSLTRFLIVSTIALLFLGPIALGYYGLGIGSERNAKIVAQREQDCAPEFKDINGRCPKSLRSTYGRGYRGGSGGFGK